MTRGKPLIMSLQPGSKVRERSKRDAESAFKSSRLPKNPPSELQDHEEARRAWRALMRAHERLPAELFNSLDRGFLVNYCLAVQARADAQKLAKSIFESYEEGKSELQDLLKARVELRMSTRLVADLEKQIYATPKSRAGVSPDSKPRPGDDAIDGELSRYAEIFTKAVENDS
jgi:hypothetical protein